MIHIKIFTRYLEHRLWLWHCVALEDFHVALVVLHNLLGLHLLPTHGLHHQISEEARLLYVTFFISYNERMHEVFCLFRSPGVKKGLHERLNVFDKLFINLLDVPLEVWVGSHVAACQVFTSISIH